MLLNYLFQIVFYKDGYGGLEHSFSSTNFFDGTRLDQKKSYQKFLSLLSHEHFHLWNVKRIRPQGLGPFDYSQEVYTKELWIAEGITSYYDDHFVYRAGIMSKEDYLQIITDNISHLENYKNSKVNSLSESSFDAWTRFYRQNENSINTVVSYYLKGGLVMMLLDFQIIQKSKGKKSFDNVMQDLYSLYKKRPETGITRDEFFAIVEKHTSQNMKTFVQSYIDGTTAISWQRGFNAFGIKMKPPKS